MLHISNCCMCTKQSGYQKCVPKFHCYHAITNCKTACVGLLKTNEITWWTGVKCEWRYNSLWWKHSVVGNSTTVFQHTSTTLQWSQTQQPQRFTVILLITISSKLQRKLFPKLSIDMWNSYKIYYNLQTIFWS